MEGFEGDGLLLKAEHARLLQEHEALKADYSDLQILYENTIEHGTALENELFEKSKSLLGMQNKMKKYLSPQLYASLVGGGNAATTNKHERKRLTIYFSDIVGFSDLTDSIESELLSDILNSYLNRMSSIALKHGGTVDKFIGDAILVFFGDPEFIDDKTHAHKCMEMALEMRDELRVLREGWKLKGIDRTLRVRAGINTGYCTVGNFGSENRMDYTIIGGQVNLAARLQTAAAPDTIIMSRATMSLVQDRFELRNLGFMQLKGIHTPEEVYELVGTLAAAEEIEPLVKIDGSSLQSSARNIDLKDLNYLERAAIKRQLAEVLEILDTQSQAPQK